MPYFNAIDMILAQMRGQLPIDRPAPADLPDFLRPQYTPLPGAPSSPAADRAFADMARTQAEMRATPPPGPAPAPPPAERREPSTPIAPLATPSRPFMPYAPDDAPSLADLLRDTPPPTTPLRSPFEGGAGLANAPAMTGFDPLNPSRVTDGRRFVTESVNGQPINQWTVLPNGRVIMDRHLPSNAPRLPGGADPLGNMPTITHQPATAPRDYRFPDPLSRSRQVPNPNYIPDLSRGNVTGLPDAPGPADVMGRALPDLGDRNQTIRLPQQLDAAGRAPAAFTPPRARPGAEPPLPPVDPRLVAALAQNPAAAPPLSPADNPGWGWVRSIRGDGRGPGGDVTQWHGSPSAQPGPAPGVAWPPPRPSDEDAARLAVDYQQFVAGRVAGGFSIPQAHEEWVQSGRQVPTYVQPTPPLTPAPPGTPTTGGPPLMPWRQMPVLLMPQRQGEQARPHPLAGMVYPPNMDPIRDFFGPGGIPEALAAEEVQAMLGRIAALNQQNPEYVQRNWPVLRTVMERLATPGTVGSTLYNRGWLGWTREQELAHHLDRLLEAARLWQVGAGLQGSARSGFERVHGPVLP